MNCTSCNKDKKTCHCSTSIGSSSPVQGQRGEKGERGSRILTGEGAPSKALGFEGDFYLDTLTNNYYIKNEFCEWILEGALTGGTGEQGEQGEQGLPGTNGEDGGDGREIELRNNGSFVQWRYVGDAGWVDLVELTSLQGPTGATGESGCSLLQGAGVPSSLLGKNCDSYIDLSTADIYLKASGSWVKTGNIGFSTGDDETGNFYTTNTANEDVTKFVAVYDSQNFDDAVSDIILNIGTYGYAVKFDNDNSLPYFDDENNWNVNKWEAPKAYSIVEFHVEITLNTTVDATLFPDTFAGGCIVALVRNRAGVETVMTYIDPRVEETGLKRLADAEFPKTANIVHQVSSVEIGDLYFIKVVIVVYDPIQTTLLLSQEPYTLGGDVYVEAGGEFWNQTI